MNPDDAGKRVDELIHLADKALAGPTTGAQRGQTILSTELVAEFRSAGMSVLESLFPPNHTYIRDFDEQTAKGWKESIEGARGILRALKSDLVSGWLNSARGLIAAEIFSDFIEMAEHLLGEGYKDAAAVLGGGALEQRLRELCVRHNIQITTPRDARDVSRKADSLNADLAKANVYHVTEQKNVTAWLGLRNDAAHGEYNKYTKEQVGDFLSGIRRFLAATNA